MKRIEKPIIVVLGAPNAASGELLPTAKARAVAALQQYEIDPDRMMLLTGGFGVHFNTTGRPHFEYVAEFLHNRGVPKAAILGSILTSNTIDDAQSSATFLSKFAGPLQLKVVTSDFHLARCRLLFEHAFPKDTKVEMIPAPSMLASAKLCEALRHEAEAIAKLA